MAQRPSLSLGPAARLPDASLSPERLLHHLARGRRLQAQALRQACQTGLTALARSLQRARRASPALLGTGPNLHSHDGQPAR